MIDKELSLIVYPLPADNPNPTFGLWVAESQEFTYLHPLDGKPEKYRFHLRGDTGEEARAKAQKQLDWFNGDRGNCIIEIDDFTEEQLARVTSQ